MEYKAYEPELKGKTVEDKEANGDYHVYEYDDNGYMIKETFYLKDGKMFDSYEYVRWEDGKLMKEIFTDENGKSRVCHEYFYNPDGTIKEEYADVVY